ncbi:MAG: hypothetical protein AMXMBFR78_30700 [Rubrivivax sp.]
MPSRSPLMRRITRWVLLLWLLAFGAGIANACVQRAALHGAASAQADSAAAAQEPLPCHDEAASDEAAREALADPAAPPAQAACAKQCADEALRMPVLEHAFDVGASLALAPLPTLGLALAEPAPVASTAASPVPPARPRLPVAIAFLRLTL